jgi:signal transduction histidine kinase
MMDRKNTYMGAEPELNQRDLLDRLREENSFLRSALEKTESGKELIRQKEEFSLLLDVGKLIVSELNLEKVLRLVASKARELVHAELLVVPMLNEKRDQYTYMAASGTYADEVLGKSFAVHVGMCGWVLQNERSLLFGEASPSWLDEKTVWEEGQQSALLVPLFGRNKIIGGLSALGKTGGASFSPHDLDLLTMFANQVSTAIETAILFQQVEKELAERKRAEELLEEHKRFAENLIENSAVATFVLDPQHRVVIWNKACEELAGIPASDMIGTDNQWKPFYDHKRPSLADIVIDGDLNRLPGLYSVYAKSALAPNGLHAEGWYFKVRGKDRYLLFDAAPIYDSRGSLIAAIETLQDITERKLFEEQLLQAQKMEAVGQLAAGIAHDFNNLLTAIMGYAGMYQKKLQPDDPLRLYADEIVATSKRAANLTRSLVTFSRKQIINPVPVDLNDIITRIGKLLLRLIGDDIEFRVEPAREELLIMADIGQIEQVLINLATNARDAMPEAGALTIETKLVDTDEEFSGRHLFAKRGRYARISVTDTGIGMDDATKEKIFEPFFTTKEAGKGSGLGLSVAYGIIKQHNGNIDVYSEPGRGTTFRIYLPLIESKILETRAEELPEPKGGTETVLLAEDDPYVRDLIKAILEEAGYTVLEAADGDGAIKVFTENKDAIQLVLLDVIMPKKHGKEVHNVIKRTNPDSKVLFMSGYEVNLIFKKGVLEEGLNFIQKPVTRDELLRKVREVLDT